MDISSIRSLPLSAVSGHSAMDKKIEALIQSIKRLTTDSAFASKTAKKIKELKNLLIEVILANMEGSKVKGIEAKINAVMKSLHEDRSFFNSAPMKMENKPT